MLASPVAGSVAERAGLRGGEQVLHAAFDGMPPQDIDRSKMCAGC